MTPGLQGRSRPSFEPWWGIGRTPTLGSGERDALAILGPLEVVCDGDASPLADCASGRARSTASRRGPCRARDRLIDDVWEGRLRRRPTRRCRSTCRSCARPSRRAPSCARAVAEGSVSVDGRRPRHASASSASSTRREYDATLALSPRRAPWPTWPASRSWRPSAPASTSSGWSRPRLGSTAKLDAGPTRRGDRAAHRAWPRGPPTPRAADRDADDRPLPGGTPRRGVAGV